MQGNKFSLPPQAPIKEFSSVSINGDGIPRMEDPSSISTTRTTSTSSSPEALKVLLETIVQLQSKQSDSIRIVHHSQISSHDPFLRPINSIVFGIDTKNRQQEQQSSSSLPSTSSYVLAILDSQDRVNQTLLEQIVLESTHLWMDGDERQDLLFLAPSEQLVQFCGFVSGTIPPLGLSPPPLLTIVEQSLLEILPTTSTSSSTPQPTMVLVAGGGLPNQSILLPISTLLDHVSPIKVASFRMKVPATIVRRTLSTSSSMATSAIVSNQYHAINTTQQPPQQQQYHFKPYFAIAPPSTQLALQIIQEGGEPSPTQFQSQETPSSSSSSSPLLLRPEWVCIVGRISGVRQMAKRLVFCDFAPPHYQHNNHHHNNSDNNINSNHDSNDDIHPWRSPTTGKDMAVQLILGKTICQQMGMEAAEFLLRRLKPGQLVLVQGKTNVGNRNSLKNWVSKTSLDIVVFQLDLLQVEREYNVAATAMATTIATTAAPSFSRPLHSKAKMTIQQATSTIKSTANPEPLYSNDLAYLQLQDMYPDTTLQDAVRIVNDLSGIQQFHQDMIDWLETHPEQVGLVGLDAEWKPNFLAGEESQPVLLLQICLHETQQVYLLDLQTLLRPLCSIWEPMNELESATAEAISLLYRTERFIKIGFQLHNDLQRLAASYPHLHPRAFGEIYSVLEISILGMKILQMTKETTGSHARIVTSSLVKMTEGFVQRTLNKEQQISDWSIRPLSPAQLEYAALDAIVTPYMAELLISRVRANFLVMASSESPTTTTTGLVTPTTSIVLGRREMDMAFHGLVTNWRLLLVSSNETMAIRRWNAKRMVGDSYLVVGQTWTSGDVPPTLPTLPPTDDVMIPFIDLQGIRRIPTPTLRIMDTTKLLDSVIGTYIAKSKERCIWQLVDSTPVDDGANDDQDIDDGKSQQALSKLDFEARAGFVELANAVILFVTLPTKDGRRQSRSYPNEWLEDGSILTWFIKDYDWQQGSSNLAKKMMDNDATSVILMARRGKDIFYCCGRCRVVTLDAAANQGKDLGSRSDQWNIVKLYLLLMDFGRLQELEEFRGLVNPGYS